MSETKAPPKIRRYAVTSWQRSIRGRVEDSGGRSYYIIHEGHVHTEHGTVIIDHAVEHERGTERVRSVLLRMEMWYEGRVYSTMDRKLASRQYLVTLAKRFAREVAEQEARP